MSLNEGVDDEDETTTLLPKELCPPTDGVGGKQKTPSLSLSCVVISNATVGKTIHTIWGAVLIAMNLTGPGIPLLPLMMQQVRRKVVLFCVFFFVRSFLFDRVLEGRICITHNCTYYYWNYDWSFGYCHYRGHEIYAYK